MRALPITLFLFLAVIGLPLSCLDPCQCPEIQGAYYRATDIYLANTRFVNNCCTFPAMPADTIPWAEYRGNLTFAPEFYGQTAPRVLKSDLTLPFSMPAAMACKCPGDGWLGMQERIQDLEISTVFDYDSQHPSGSRMDDIIFLRINGDTLLLADYLQQPREPLRSLSLDWWLASGPAQNGSYATNVKITLDNGTMFSGQTDVVQLN